MNEWKKPLNLTNFNCSKIFSCLGRYLSPSESLILYLPTFPGKVFPLLFILSDILSFFCWKIMDKHLGKRRRKREDKKTSNCYSEGSEILHHVLIYFICSTKNFYPYEFFLILVKVCFHFPSLSQKYLHFQALQLFT